MLSSKTIFIRPKGRVKLKKSRIWETKNLSTDADSRTDTIFKRLQDLSLKKLKIKNGAVKFQVKFFK